MRYLLILGGLYLGAGGLLVACSGSSGGGGGAAKACDVVGATESCSCPGGAMGERVCGDDMAFGGCLGCPDVDAAMPFDGRCFRCLDDDPYALLCGPDDTVEQSDGNTACVDGSSVTACSTLADCCEAFRRTTGVAETCGGCLSPFTGTNCDECAARFAGPECDQCAEGFTGDGCETPSTGNTPVGLNAETAAAAVNTYAEIAYATYSDSLITAQALDQAITAFVDAPSAAGLEAAKNAWLAARDRYLETEVYRFYEGPIDNAEGPEGLLNAWPMDEAYVDYVEGDCCSGIINDTSVAITAEELEGLNEAGKDDNIATGYHAIEFLLWGQDLDDAGPGARPFTDYLTDGNGTAANQDRRGLYLRTVSTMLVGHLEMLKNAWAPDADNYRASFVAADPQEGIRRIMTGMIILAGFETGGERVQAALTSGDKEDEHSCFSDNTHRDMIQDVQGIVNVFKGTYGSITGTGIKDVIEASDAALAAEITGKLSEALAAANALPVPFDQAIATTNTEGRAIVETLVTKLRSAESSLESAFTLFGLEIPVAE